jgi:integrase-like protein/amino acid permease-like protein
MRRTDHAATPLRRSLTTPKIVFLVVAAAAPMSGVVGSVPLAFAIGNGVGVPATFVLAGLTLLCFSVGYAAMSREIVNTGGFYTNIGHGLGRPLAVSGGLIAVVAYNAVVAGVAGAFGYFSELVAASHGLHVAWVVWAAAGTAAMGFMGYRRIDLSARVLAVLMVAEVAVLVLLALSIVAHRGTDAFPGTTFRPDTVLAPGLGVALMFALISYVGFEAAALYGEESHDPRRSVPVATYVSVVLITVRPAEVCGLRWADVDLGKATLDIANTRTLMGNKTVVEKDTKSAAGERLLPLPALVREALKRFRATQMAEKLAAGEAYENSGYLLVDELGRPLNGRHLRVRAYKIMAENALRRVRLYDARASCFTYLANNGVPDHLLALWAGHTSVKTTKRWYVKPGVEDLHPAADTWGGLASSPDPLP